MILERKRERREVMADACACALARLGSEGAYRSACAGVGESPAANGGHGDAKTARCFEIGDPEDPSINITFRASPNFSIGGQLFCLKLSISITSKF